MELKKYSLPHIIHDQYCKNTVKNYNGNRFTGESYFLAHLSNHEDIAEATGIASIILSVPFFFFLGFFFGMLSIIGINFILAVVLSTLDTYSTRKYRIRINLKTTMDRLLKKDHKENGWY